MIILLPTAETVQRMAYPPDIGLYAYDGAESLVDHVPSLDNYVPITDIRILSGCSAEYTFTHSKKSITIGVNSPTYTKVMAVVLDTGELAAIALDNRNLIDVNRTYRLSAAYKRLHCLLHAAHTKPKLVTLSGRNLEFVSRVENSEHASSSGDPWWNTHIMLEVNQTIEKKFLIWKWSDTVVAWKDDHLHRYDAGWIDEATQALSVEYNVRSK